MSDPFQERSTTQLYREAQIGLGIIAMLLAVFVYLLIDRFTEDDFPMAALAKSPNASLTTNTAERTATRTESINPAPINPQQRIPAGSPQGTDNHVVTPVVAGDAPLPIGQSSLVARVNHEESLQPSIDSATQPRIGLEEPSANSFPSADPKRKPEPVIRFQSPNSELSNELPTTPSTRKQSDISVAKLRQKKIAEAAADLRSTLEQLESSRNKITNRMQANQKKSDASSRDNSFAAMKPIPRQPANDLPLPTEINSIEPKRLQPLAKSNSNASTLSKPTIDDSSMAIDEPTMTAPHPVAPDSTSVLQTSHTEWPEAEPASPVSAPVKKTDYRQVVADSNDSFYTIAQSNYGDGRYFRSLFQFNQEHGFAKEDLNPGDTVLVPSFEELQSQFGDLSDSDAVLKNGRSGAKPISERMYVTKAGDTLFEIARQQIGQASRFQDLLELNRQYLDTEDHLERLPEGIRLVLPAPSVQ